MLVDWLASTYRAGQKLSGILYLHRIDENSHEELVSTQSQHA